MFAGIKQFHLTMRFNISHTCVANIMKQWEKIDDPNITYDEHHRRLTGTTWIIDLIQSASQTWYLQFDGTVHENDHDMPCINLQETLDDRIWIITHPFTMDTAIFSELRFNPTIGLPTECTKHQAVLQKVVFEYHSNDTIGSDQA